MLSGLYNPICYIDRVTCYADIGKLMYVASKVYDA